MKTFTAENSAEKDAWGNLEVMSPHRLPSRAAPALLFKYSQHCEADKVLLIMCCMNVWVNTACRVKCFL